MNISLLIIKFENEIKAHEIPLFRGAIIKSLEDKQLLFHNHKDEGYRYAYPLIQYKKISGKAAIVCINKGIESISELLKLQDLHLSLGEREINATIESIVPQTFNVSISEKLIQYKLTQWLPLNADNYKRYNEEKSLSGKVSMLESILQANILSFLKGVELFSEDIIECNISELSKPRLIKSKGVKMMSFDIVFSTNINLPNYIGLGKQVSKNFGILEKTK